MRQHSVISQHLLVKGTNQDKAFAGAGNAVWGLALFWGQSGDKIISDYAGRSNKDVQAASDLSGFIIIGLCSEAKGPNAVCRALGGFSVSSMPVDVVEVVPPCGGGRRRLRN